MANLAFRAVKYQTDEALEEDMAEWKVNLVNTKVGSPETREQVPIKFCTAAEFANFAEAREDSRLKIESLFKAETLICLDLTTYGKKIEIFGSPESDENQRIELRLQ